jgi:hypothetical protein
MVARMEERTVAVMEMVSKLQTCMFCILGDDVFINADDIGLWSYFSVRYPCTT